MTEEEILCYNKGCGQKFDPSTNREDSCTFHPGVPVFHDALKGWSCCRKRSTDFTEFLNIPGCTKGPHSNEKPVEPEKPEQPVNEDKNEVIIVQAPHPKPLSKEVTERPSTDEPMVRLKSTIGASLKQALEKELQKLSVEEKSEEKEVNAETQVTAGTSCKNKGCHKSYVDDNSNLKTCLYHSGVPIFHEGMKYWTCCNRKTSDFDNFLNQEGCTSGKHLWVKKEDPQKIVACRHDWHQTPGFVTLSVFSKVALPEKSYVEVNQVQMKIHIEFEGGKSIFDKSLILFGIIDPSKSNVKMLGTKVEINLKKAEPGSWNKLELPQQQDQAKEEEEDVDDELQ